MINIGKISYNGVKLKVWFNEKAKIYTFSGDYNIGLLLQGWPYDNGMNLYRDFQLVPHEVNKTLFYIELVPGVVDFVSSRETIDFTDRTRKFVSETHKFLRGTTNIAKMLLALDDKTFNSICQNRFLYQLTIKSKETEAIKKFENKMADYKIEVKNLAVIQKDRWATYSTLSQLDHDMFGQYNLYSVKTNDYFDRNRKPVVVDLFKSYMQGINVPQNLLVIHNSTSRGIRRKILANVKKEGNNKSLLFIENKLSEEEKKKFKSIKFLNAIILEEDEYDLPTKANEKKDKSRESIQSVRKLKMKNRSLKSFELSTEILNGNIPEDKNTFIVVSNILNWTHRYRVIAGSHWMATKSEEVVLVETSRVATVYDTLVEDGYKNVMFVESGNISSKNRTVLEEVSYIDVSQFDNDSLLIRYIYAKIKNDIFRYSIVEESKAKVLRALVLNKLKGDKKLEVLDLEEFNNNKDSIYDVDFQALFDEKNEKFEQNKEIINYLEKIIHQVQMIVTYLSKDVDKVVKILEITMP